MTDTRAALDDRYGRRPGRRRAARVGVIAGVTVLAVAAAIWVASIGLFSPAGEVEGQTIGYSLIDGGVRVRAQVSAPSGHAVSCTVEADAKDGTIVGWKTVRLPASGGRIRPFEVDVRATAPVHNGLINHCRLT